MNNNTPVKEKKSKKPDNEYKIWSDASNIAYGWIASSLVIFTICGIATTSVSGNGTIVKMNLNHDHIIIGSAGILTFIAIFYSLFISPKGEEFFRKRDEAISSHFDRTKKVASQKINEMDVSKSKKTTAAIDMKFQEINWVRRYTSTDTFLFISVIALFISISLSIFQSTGVILALSYIFYAVGVSFSSAIVVQWTIISKGMKKLMNNKPKQEDIIA